MITIRKHKQKSEPGSMHHEKSWLMANAYGPIPSIENRFINYSHNFMYVVRISYYYQTEDYG